MKRFFTSMKVLILLLLILFGFACAKAEDPATVADRKLFEADGYTVYYEVVAQDQVDQVVGSLAQYVKTEDVDMQANRLLYILYTGAEQDGKEVRLGKVFFSINWGNLLFRIDGAEYTQTSMLMNSGTQTFITYLFVPAETADDADVSIQYRE